MNEIMDLAGALRHEHPVATVVVVAGPATGARLVVEAECVLGGTGSEALDAALAAEARAMLNQGLTGFRSFGPDGESRELREAGVTEVELERICSPVGLDIGGRTTEETAIAIAAEMIARKNGRPGGSLGYAAGRIHNDEFEAGVR